MKSNYDGAEHHAAWKRGWIIIPILSVSLMFSLMFIGWPVSTASQIPLWMHIFYFIGRYLGPDQDQLSSTSGDNRMYRELGIFGLLAGFWWTCYAYLMFMIARLGGFAHPWYGAHGTWLTHSIFPGTVIRWIWFNIPIVFVIWLIKWLPSTDVIIPYIIGSFLPMCISDGIHIYIVDKIGVFDGKRRTN